MKTQILMMLLLAGLFFQTCTAQPNPEIEKIKKVVKSFAMAGETYNMATLEKVLHSDYRVIANQFKDEEPTTILSREVYMSLIEQKKFGGTAYKVKFHSVEVTSHTSMVDVEFNSPKSSMHMYLLLTQDKQGDWTIVSDVPVVEMKG